MTLSELRTTQKQSILKIASKRGAKNLRVFRSVARGQSDESSDIDFLVDLEPSRTLFDLSGLAVDLEILLRRRVDVVTERGLRPRVRERVLAEAIPL
jgi:predicted nucleotidyltransferase